MSPPKAGSAVSEQIAIDPVIIAIANFLLPAQFVLVHGIVQELLLSRRDRWSSDFLVRIIVGYGYVALVE